MREKALVKLILKGDSSAGEMFVDTYYPPVYRLLLHLCRNRDIAEDLAQQTFAAAWKGLTEFRFGSSIGTWLHQIARREYMHWLRDIKPTLPIHLMCETTNSEQGHSTNRMLIYDALAQLSEDQRLCFLLVYVQQLTVKEASLVLEIPVGTVKSRLFAAREKLKLFITEDLENKAEQPKQKDLVNVEGVTNETC